MAEAAAGFDPRRLLLVGGVIAVLIFSGLFFLFRSCAPAAGGHKAGYVQVYSNLELRDSANVVARLKELNIPYEIREDGRALAVPKEKADQARLGLAEKNLPAGGVVGWEIFDESKLGATDFDRRIQLIRAISGELSRTIRRIDGVEDVRVQVVIPETQLFAATTAPVTASVMIRLRPGIQLAAEKINGVVHLVASSVENLQPENVTVVDDFGRILSAKGALAVKLAPTPLSGEIPVVVATAEKVAVISAEVILQKTASPSTSAIISTEAAAERQPLSTEAAFLARVATMTVEERILLKAQAKKELEQELAGKAQELLNRYYPLNSIIIKVTADIIPVKELELRARDLKIKKLYIIGLVDNRVDFTKNLRQSTYTTIAAATGYNKKRGDRIVLQRVPFHLASSPLETAKKTASVQPPKRNFFSLLMASVFVRQLVWWGGAMLIVVMIIWGIGLLAFRREKLAPAAEEAGISPVAPPTPRERFSKLDQVKAMAEQNPQAIADLLKRWLSE